ncbi:MAG: serine-pyruvate aminotransferase/archaeal aspartate aminotransferase [Frondihabitans sp.]|nr:serine-pyruvate aminotransferase/archaeal aspartate aminotransferase [Frondihabitans sp.]
MTLRPEDLLDQPPLAPSELTHLEDLARQVLATSNDVIIVQAEAILALEGVARSVGAQGRVALNVVTGPYGRVFGQWMREAGSDVIDLASEFDAVVNPDAVIAAIETHSPSVVAIVHAEAATGGTNPLGPVLRAAHEHGAVTVVDAVASIGAEPVLVDDWQIDIAVIGGQKSLAGPAGVSAVALSAAAWTLIDSTPNAPRGSSLSLLDWRDGWLRTDRSVIPGMPSWLESRALIAALERVLAEGLVATNDRHRQASVATVAGAAELGLSPWQTGGVETLAPVVTALRLPEPGALSDGALGGIVSPGNGDLRGRLFRVNHTGRAAALDRIVDALERVAAALDVPADDAVRAARAAWER